MEQRLPRTSALWSLILAAGQGKRLAPITTALCGRWLPKQFVALTSRRTLLQETVERTESLVATTRTVVVVSERDEEIARVQLGRYPGVEVVRQPSDRGTAAGLMLGLAHVRARDPQAEVVVFPADHHVKDAAAWCAAVRRARAAARIAPSRVALLGAPADRPATDLGWIVPGAPLSSTVATSRAALVRRFVEKPPLPQALSLLDEGGLWNTMVVVARVGAIWRLGKSLLPAQMQQFEWYLRAIRHARAYDLLTRQYDRLTPSDLSRDILSVAPGLAVVPVVGSGWFDCGTPERLVDWLVASDDPSGILARIARVDGARSDALRTALPSA
jgi:mannose-1-phosphate guanylyltransferase